MANPRSGDTIVTVLTGEDALRARLKGALTVLQWIAALPHTHTGSHTGWQQCAACLAEGGLQADGGDK